MRSFLKQAREVADINLVPPRPLLRPLPRARLRARNRGEQAGWRMRRERGRVQLVTLVDVNWRPMFWPGSPEAARKEILAYLEGACFVKMTDEEAAFLFGVDRAVRPRATRRRPEPRDPASCAPGPWLRCPCTR
jgi:hypothetical protein